MSGITDFYREPSPTSDLGRHAELAAGLPADAEALSAIVRGLLVHNLDVKARGLRLPAERAAPGGRRRAVERSPGGLRD
jgi:hypothetical protein